jgi:predicted ThiF/HesA family dinucleotide-utilizing enzyme
MSTSTAHSDLTTSIDGSEAADRARRFGGIARLYGAPALAAFEGAHVAVIGIGGVGSWVAEALARSAVGTLTLIDLDNVAESNTNRQIHALDGNYGKPKVEAMAERIAAINPSCDVRLVEDFVEPDNFTATLGGGFDYVIDAIDSVRTKTALIAWCVERKQPLITIGGAGGQLDPTRIRIDDLARSESEIQGERGVFRRTADLSGSRGVRYRWASRARHHLAGAHGADRSELRGIRFERVRDGEFRFRRGRACAAGLGETGGLKAGSKRGRSRMEAGSKPASEARLMCACCLLDACGASENAARENRAD